jgi:hypothetical protein
MTSGVELAEAYGLCLSRAVPDEELDPFVDSLAERRIATFRREWAIANYEASLVKTPPACRLMSRSPPDGKPALTVRSTRPAAHGGQSARCWTRGLQRPGDVEDASLFDRKTSRLTGIGSPLLVALIESD